MLTYRERIRSVTTRRLCLLFVLTIAVLGVGLRFYHLDWKVYSFDETTTSIRASGHSEADFLHFVNDGRTHRLADLTRFQQYDPSISYVKAVRSLAKEEPQHPPLYFLLARFMSAEGLTSIWERRLPSAIFAALILPAFWWLTFELYKSKAVAWVGCSLIAVSPFHVAYAQQDREYSLWALAIVISSGALLCALRKNPKLAWLLYALAMTASLWTYTLSLYVLLSHAIFVFAFADRSRANRKSFMLAAGAAVLAFSPWLYAIAINSARISATTSWDSAKLPFKIMAEKWIFNCIAVFFDLEYLSLHFLPIVALVALLIVCSVVRMIHTAPRRSAGFVVLLGSISACAMLLPDMMKGESHSTVARYLTPLWLAIELAAAYAIGTGGWGINVQRIKVLAWRIAALGIIVVGAASCVVSSQAQYWWPASEAKAIPAMAQVLNAKNSQGLIQYAGDEFYFLALSNYVRAPVRFHQHDLLREKRSRFEPAVYFIGRPVQLTDVAIAIKPRTLRRMPLATFFPEQDASVTNLRVEAAAARNTMPTLADIALWTITPNGASRAIVLNR